MTKKKNQGAGKGSKPRPIAIPYREYLNRFDQINWNDTTQETHNVEKRVKENSKPSKKERS